MYLYGHAPKNAQPDDGRARRGNAGRDSYLQNQAAGNDRVRVGIFLAHASAGLRLHPAWEFAGQSSLQMPSVSWYFLYPWHVYKKPVSGYGELLGGN